MISNVVIFTVDTLGALRSVSRMFDIIRNGIISTTCRALTKYIVPKKKRNIDLSNMNVNPNTPSPGPKPRPKRHVAIFHRCNNSPNATKEEKELAMSMMMSRNDSQQLKEFYEQKLQSLHDSQKSKASELLAVKKENRSLKRKLSQIHDVSTLN